MATMLPAQTASPPVHTTSLRGLKKIHTGKVRDIYEIDAHSMLIVTTDRLSAFDVVLPDPIPDKGRVLNSISNFWFERTQHIVPNHLTGRSVVRGGQRSGRARAARRSRRHRQAPEDRAAGSRGARLRDRLGMEGLPEVRHHLRHQTTRGAQAGARNCRRRCSRRRPRRPSATRTRPSVSSRRRTSWATTSPARVRDTAIAIYEFAAKYALERGIIIADTKFEFALDADGSLVLIDEVLTPDSSRFWPADTWREGTSPPSFDKQFVRDYLETLDWNKKAPGPEACRRKSSPARAPNISKRSAA